MYVGQSIKRREDDRFLTGRGNYVDDINAPNAAYAAFVRSPLAHAQIRKLDTARAKNMPGVLAVITGEDWAAAGLGKAPCISPVNFSDGRKMNTATRPILVAAKVCHVGDPIAAVIAERRWQALDAAEAVEVDYAALPAVTDAGAALTDGAPVLHEALGTNLIFDVEHGDKPATATAFVAAHHIAELDLINNRISANPIEPRCCLGKHDRATDHYTLYTSNQAPHLLRNWLAEDTLFIPEHKLRVVAPDVGGGFGMKLTVYPEEATVLWAAQVVGRPVRWVATRSVSLISDTQGHETTYCQIVADRLRCDIDDVELVFGDTDRLIAGVGTWGSRSLVMAGMALTTAADKIFAKCQQLAAHLLECAEADLDVENGQFTVKGTDHRLSFREVSRAAYHGSNLPEQFEIGLDETVFYEPEAWVFSSSIHLAVVLVDAETGRVTRRDYYAVDDSGRVINPMIVEGQLHGAILQGAGQAMIESCVYDQTTGQLLSGSFMDYGMPRASDRPSFRTDFQETPAPSDPLGAKGAGESGTLGAPPAIVNAVSDALAHMGLNHIDMPLTPDRIWRALKDRPDLRP